jgi:hypothetical protein
LLHHLDFTCLSDPLLYHIDPAKKKAIRDRPDTGFGIVRTDGGHEDLIAMIPPSLLAGSEQGRAFQMRLPITSAMKKETYVIDSYIDADYDSASSSPQVS